jgi:hypothetical protein
MLRQNLGDRRRQRGLAMVDVTNRPHVAVRLISIKFLFRHFSFSSASNYAGTKSSPPAS